ncbi:hypothetical protein HT105_25500, partial [Bacteroides fragilis]|nr:hypothetical protein [Bacteroides fragilis]
MLYIFNGGNGAPLVTQPFELPHEFAGKKQDKNEVTGPMLYIFNGGNGAPLVTQPFELPHEFAGKK